MLFLLTKTLLDGALAQVLRQDFFLPFGVKALAATATSHGITSRFILFGTLAGQVRIFTLLEDMHLHLLRLPGLSCSPTLPGG